jgi:MoaA/NifB/PqqE/SkfB family radical SAM enzyme
MSIDSNPFKILYYKDKLDQLANGEIPLPTMLEIDPYDSCNFHCPWCSSRTSINKSQNRIIEPHRFHILEEFAKFAKVKGIYYCGGGEPTLNPYLGGYMLRTYGLNIKNYITTNGSNLNCSNLIERLVDFCSWIGVSINSGTEKMWRRYAPKDLSYEEFLKGLKRLNDYRTKVNRNVETNYKFVYDPVSYVDIPQAVSLAIDLGFTKITIKPADLSFSKKEMYWDDRIIKCINDMINSVKDLKSIQVDCGSFYPNLDVDLKVLRNYKLCWTGCLAPVFGADGNIQICCVRRSEKPYHKWDDGYLNEWWGCEDHRRILFGFNPNDECPLKCKMGGYNSIFQEMFVEKNFSVGSI